MPDSPDLLTAAQALICRIDDVPARIDWPELAALRAAVDAAKAAGDDGALFRLLASHLAQMGRDENGRITFTCDFSREENSAQMQQAFRRGIQAAVRIVRAAMAAEGQGEGK